MENFLTIKEWQFFEVYGQLHCFFYVYEALSLKGRDKWETSNTERRACGVLRGFLGIKGECHAAFWGADGRVSVSNSVWSSFSAQITLSCHTSISEIHLASASAASTKSLLLWCEHVRTQVVPNTNSTWERAVQDWHSRAESLRM